MYKNKIKGKIIVKNVITRKSGYLYYIDGKGNLCETESGLQKAIKLNVGRKHTSKSLKSYRKAGEKRKKLNLPKSFWIRKYIINRKSSLILAKELGVCKATILKELEIFNIKRRTNSEASNRKTWEKRYGKEKAKEMKIKQSKFMIGRSMSTKGKTYEEIYGQETARRLKKIRSDCMKESKINLDLDLIKKFYLSEKMSLEDIGEIMGVNKTTIVNRLKEICILRRKNQTEKSILKIKKARAKQILPKRDSSIEVKIQNFLKKLGIEFFTHQYIKIEHGYQCDILIPSMNLVIECDGNYWHKYPIGNELDHIRTKELIEKGFRVLRLWEFEINDMTIDKFKERLKK